MSNVIRLCDRERRDCVTPPMKIGRGGLQSLFESWCSITLNFEKLQDYLDQLRPALEAIPEGPEKSRAILLMKVAEVQIRDCHMQSIGTSAALARALATTLRPAVKHGAAD
jgi:hypothetical protein